MYVYYVQLTIRMGGGNIAIPTVNFLGDASPSPMVDAYGDSEIVLNRLVIAGGAADNISVFL